MINLETPWGLQQRGLGLPKTQTEITFQCSWRLPSYHLQLERLPLKPAVKTTEASQGNKQIFFAEELPSLACHLTSLLQTGIRQRWLLPRGHAQP